MICSYSEVFSFRASFLLNITKLYQTMAENLTKSQIDEIQSAFETFDRDHDGLITIEARLKLKISSVKLRDLHISESLLTLLLYVETDRQLCL